MKKKFKVIKIIDDTTLVINAGSSNNAEIGDIMEIHGKSETIYDPETKENLGQIDVIKDSLKITKTYEKMCICESAFVSNYFSSILNNSLFTSTQRKLDVEPTEISGTGDKTIRIGDEAILIKNKTKVENVKSE